MKLITLKRFFVSISSFVCNYPVIGSNAGLNPKLPLISVIPPSLIPKAVPRPQFKDLGLTFTASNLSRSPPIQLPKSCSVLHLVGPLPNIPKISLSACLQIVPRPILSPQKKREETGSSVEVLKGIAVGVTGSLIGVPFEMKRTQMNDGATKLDLKEAVKSYPKILKAKMPNRMMGSSLYMGSVPAASTIVSDVVDNPLGVKVASSAIAGLVPCMVTAPADKIAEKMEKGVKSSFSTTLKTSVEKEGILSLWRGSITATTAYVMHKVLFFPGAHVIKEKIEEGSKEVTARQSLANSMLAGAIASVPTAPVSHFFYRISADQRSQVAGTENPPRGMLSTAKTITQSAFKQCGLKGLLPEIFKGLSATMLRTPIVGAVTIATCELVNQITKQ